jgi:hypothetical protein
MKTLLLFCGLTLTAPLWSDESADHARQALHEARVHYQDTVRSHGPQSKEADAARVRVRESRRAFHAQRRATTPGKF